ncbi:MAG TPA: CDP-alcohol phosphatidyltransferase family protein [Anaerolineales bacterium]|nr:CDP-alcohol phosphatidyltransferase family protein [Anaerolineales bacterium]
MRGTSRAGIKVGLPRRLVARLWAWVALDAAALAALGAVVAGGSLRRWAAWLPASLLVAAYGLAFCGSRLYLHRRPSESRVSPVLGPGMNLTLLRGLWIAPLAGLLFLPPLVGAKAWLPALLYTGAAIADQFDGYLARRTGLATPLGEALDLEFDGLGMLLAVAVAIHVGHLPLAFIAVGLARYGFVIWKLFWSRMRGGAREIPASMTRRAIAGLEMGFVSAALWPIIPPELAALAGWIFAVPFFLSFGRDAAVVAGWIDVASPAYQLWRSRLRDAATRWTPPLLRVGLLLVWGPVTVARLSGVQEWAATLTNAGVANSLTWGLLSALVQAAALMAVAIGFLGRAAAFLLVLVNGLLMAALGVTPAGLTGFALASAVLILGTGPLSAWSPEGAWLGKRRGGLA